MFSESLKVAIQITCRLEKKKVAGCKILHYLNFKISQNLFYIISSYVHTEY